MSEQIGTFQVRSDIAAGLVAAAALLTGCSAEGALPPRDPAVASTESAGSTPLIAIELASASPDQVGPGGCFEGTEIVDGLRTAKIAGEDFRSPYSKTELDILTAAARAWYKTNADSPCVSDTAKKLGVETNELPDLFGGKLKLNELKEKTPVANTWFNPETNEWEFWENQALEPTTLVFEFSDDGKTLTRKKPTGMKFICGNPISLLPKKATTPEAPSPTTAPSTPRKPSPSATPTQTPTPKPTPKPSKPSLAPKNPTEAGPSVKPSPASDNKDEVAKPAKQPQDSGNGISQPGVAPRANPSAARESVVPTQTHIGTGPAMLPQTEKPAPAPTGPTQSGLITAPGP